MITWGHEGSRTLLLVAVACGKVTARNDGGDDNGNQAPTAIVTRNMATLHRKPRGRRRHFAFVQSGLSNHFTGNPISAGTTRGCSVNKVARRFPHVDELAVTIVSR